MNERIKELAEQAGVFEYKTYYDPTFFKSVINDDKVKKFAELIVKECAKVAWYHTPDTEELEYSHLIEGKILKHFGVEE
jgi:hypothetical protein